MGYRFQEDKILRKMMPLLKILKRSYVLKNLLSIKLGNRQVC